MTEISLLVVVAAWYVVESTAWCRTATIVFSGWRTWRPRHGPAVPLGDKGGLIAGWMLPPLGTIVPASPWPFVLHEQTLELCGECLDYSALEPSSRGSTLIIDRNRRVRLESPRLAAHIAQLLTRLRAAKADRSSLIAEAARSSFDVEAVKARLAALKDEGKPVRVASSLLAVYILIAAPIVILQMGLAGTWIAILLVLLTLTAIVVVAFVRAFRRLHPGDLEACVTRAIMMTLAPISAARALDVLAWDAMAGFDPLAVTAAACDRQTFVREARRCRFDAQRAKHPSLDLIDGLIDRMNARKALLDPPASDGPVQAFCPRCSGQYVGTSLKCADCLDVPLVRPQRAG